MARVSAVIPAHNEEMTVADVVEAVRAAQLVDEVVVVDSASKDTTGEVAALHGARVIRLKRPGKGQAMSAGVRASDAGVIVFLDADLLGLKPSHIDSLIRPVLSGEVAMACGLFDSGPALNPIFLRFLPVLTGERAVWREVFESLDDEAVEGYKIEAALNSRCGDLGLERVAFVCDGLWHRTKEEKYQYGVIGFAIKGSVAKPEPVIGIRPWRDIGAVQKQKHEGPVRLDRILQTLVGQLNLHACGKGLLPGGCDLASSRSPRRWKVDR